MVKGIAFAALMLTLSPVFADCVLEPAYIKSDRFIGDYDVEKINSGGIQLSSTYGDISKDPKQFDLDTLYEIRKDGQVARFRIADKYFVNGSSFLGSAQWEQNKFPSGAGKYKFYALSTENQVAGQKVTMVGDSITWWSSGKNFRCLLSKEITGLNFVGPHTDAFGYGHAGEGGNKTIDVLERLNKIKKSDYYILHIGTNDWPIGNSDFTLNNIKSISNKLSEKGGTVLILTILPRLDEHDERNRAINEKLRAWNGRDCNCKVVDFEDEFRSLDNLPSLYWDKGLHPNIEGYRKIVGILSPKLTSAIGIDSVYLSGK